MRTLTCVMMGIVALAAVAEAADSPQFRGPNRDGKFPESGLLKAWPGDGPPLAWVAKGVGAGYASATVVGDTIYVPGTLADNQGYVFAFDLDGNMKGRIHYGEETQDKQAPGSRSTPTIEDDRMYLISGLGVVYCIKLPEGDILWQVDTMARFNGKNIQWSIAESPLIEGNTVLCSPGGPDASIAALDKMTGETVWTSKGLSEPSAYCCPDVIVHNGRRIIVTMTAKLVVGLDAKSGEVLWTHPHETDYDIHAVTPVYADGMLYYTAGYKSGGGMLKLSEDGSSITPMWTDKNLDCQHHGVVLLDGYIYGTAHGSGKGLVCLELRSGEMMWNTREVRQGVTVFADGMLYVYEGPKRGIVHLIEAGPKGYELKGAITVTQGEGTTKHWAHPTIADGRLYVRHGDALVAYDIATK